LGESYEHWNKKLEEDSGIIMVKPPPINKMKILLLTDAPKHNLALMKISTYHKKAGDEVMLNMPLWKADYRYASWIFEDGIRFGAYEAGL